MQLNRVQGDRDHPCWAHIRDTILRGEHQNKQLREPGCCRSTVHSCRHGGQESPDEGGVGRGERLHPRPGLTMPPSESPLSGPLAAPAPARKGHVRSSPRSGARVSFRDGLAPLAREPIRRRSPAV